MDHKKSTKNRLLLALWLAVTVGALASGCGQTEPQTENEPQTEEIDFTVALNENEEPYVFEETETYTNYIEMDKSWGEISASNNSAAIGDPFVLRYDGRYYMYPSTSGTYDEERGVRVFESEDLISWEYIGFAAEGVESSWGWAPEVLYYNGTFYMVVSPSGEGHYILTSDSPTGPFLPLAYLGCSFDGSLYAGDDGAIYLLYAADQGQTNVTKLSEDLMSVTSVTTYIPSYMGKWNEGPNVFRRNNILFCTYTGNNVRSESYRLGYSYCIGNDILGSWILPENNIFILNASGSGYYGLGHSSNVIGPNLDSWYTAYHTILKMNNPFHRELMIDQLVTNGTMLFANGPTYSQVAAPKSPDYEVKGVESGFISADKTGEIYTLEYNVTPESGSTVELQFAYTDGDNYGAVRWDMSREVLTLVRIENGKETELQSVAVPGMLAGKLHPVRVIKGADTVEVYLDGLMKLQVSAEGIGAGYIGVSGKAVFSYLAFTSDAFGTSDFDSVKNIPSSFPAVHYLKGENRGWSIRNAVEAEGGIRQNEPENTRINETDLSLALILDTPNDWVKYAVNAMEESWYGVCGTVTAESAGAQIQIIIDEKEIYTYTVPETGSDEEEYVNVMLGQVPLTQGNHTMKIRLCSGYLEVLTFDLVLTNPTRLTYESPLNELSETGWVYRGNWEIADDALTIVGATDEPAFAFAGDATITDFSLEVEVALLEDDSIYEGGILFHTDEICCERDGDVDECLQGYYLAFRNDQISLYRYNYSSETLDFAKVEFQGGEYHKVKITMVNNHIVIYIDDMETPLID